MENFKKVLSGIAQVFDSNPVIVKPWTADSNFTKDPVKLVPIWIKLHGLEVKYWGEKSLKKIAGLVGTVIKVDQATQHRDKLLFAKVLVEVRIDQEFPELIQFLDEKGVIIDQRVEYDWLPISCSICKGMGHTMEKCHKRVNKGKKIWAPKRVQPTNTVTVVQPKMQEPDADGFVLATRFNKHRSSQLKPIQTGNSFLALDDDDDIRVEDDMESPLGQGVTSPSPNG